MKRLLIVAALVAAPLSIQACSVTSSPMMSVDKHTFGSEPGSTATAAKIRSALQARGWKVIDEKPGAIKAKYVKGNPREPEKMHSATIIVTYAGDTYSIGYVDSENLDYNPEKGTIHRVYNRWIVFLDQDLTMAP